MQIRAEKISRSFFRKVGSGNTFAAVKELDFVLPDAKLTEITGRSGGGKSTLLNMLAGILEPTSGKVFLGETDLYSLTDEERSRLRNRSMGVIPQGQTALNSLTVIENVKLPCRLYEGASCSDEKALALLERVGIVSLSGAYPNELSGGELRRLAIARALVMDPVVLLADEPTSDLDDENTHAVLKLLRDAADGGTAVLLVTHEREAAAYADQIYRMDAGILSPAGE